MSYDINDYVFNDASLISKSANINFDKDNSSNPEYTLESFFAVYPQFKGLTELPDAIIEMYIGLANACVSYKIWKKQWQIGMALFIAHFCTVHLMSYVPEGATAREVLASGQMKGLLGSKSVGDVSVSYDFSLATQNVSDWGQFNLTMFGNQFVALAKLLTQGSMYIW